MKYKLKPEHEARFAEWRDKWIANAMSTEPMTENDREICRACWNTTSMDNRHVASGEPLETGHVNQRRPAGNGEPKIMPFTRPYEGDGSMITHTPGPWSFHAYGNPEPMKCKSQGVEFEYATYCIGSGEKLLADVRYQTNSKGYPHVDDLAEFAANARLIAAAPDLLEALELLLDGCVEVNPDGSVENYLHHTEVDRAREAVRKARGAA